MEYKHTPVGRFEWEKLILRAELDVATKLVALAAATYGNPDGTRVQPSVPRLAAELDWSEKHVQNQLSELRRLGLLEVVRQHTRGYPTRYQLTFPSAGLGSLPMRTDVDGYPWLGPRLPSRGGRKPRLTGTPVPVNQPIDQNSSSGDDGYDQNSSSGEDGLTGTPVPVTERSPELEFPITGTPVPNHRNSSSGDHTRPSKTPPVSGSYLTPTSPRPGPEQANTNQPQGPTQRAPTEPDPAAAYRAARRIVDAAPRSDRDAALAQAAASLAADGIVGVRPCTIRAADLLTRWQARGAITDQEGPRP